MEILRKMESHRKISHGITHLPRIPWDITDPAVYASINGFIFWKNTLIIASLMLFENTRGHFHPTDRAPNGHPFHTHAHTHTIRKHSLAATACRHDNNGAVAGSQRAGGIASASRISGLLFGSAAAAAARPQPCWL